ncbi:MAG: DUF6538 domain-containing protein [Roseovarius sp.]
MRRNGVFYFRRRWPAFLRKNGASEFLSISLQTHLLTEAVKRSADLLSVVETGEKDMLIELKKNPVSEARVRTMLQEIVRRGFAAMIARQEIGVTPDDTGVYLDQINSEAARIQQAQRARDWTLATDFGHEVARQNGMTASDLETPAVARQVLALMRQINELSLRVERDCDDPLHVGRTMLIDHGLSPKRDALIAPMRLSDAIEKACKEAPRDVENKIRVVGKLARTYFGDIALASLDLGQSCDFLRMVWMLPKGWGKSHGRNRYGQPGRDLSPLEEIRAADARDAQLVEDVLKCGSLSFPDKRRRLVTELTPRLTDGYLFVQRDMFNRIVRAALGAKRVGRDIDDEDRIVPSHAQLKGKMRGWHKEQKTTCGLPTRITRPKRRLSWSLEHIARLLRSPIYLGSSSIKQRSRKATTNKRVIIRDAIYWVPLIMVTMGIRPEEVLQAAVQDVIRRDNIYCILLGKDEDAVLKNEQSRRILPIPQLLLDLGFREWIVSKMQAGDTWLFPEIQPDKCHGRCYEPPDHHNLGRSRSTARHCQVGRDLAPPGRAGAWPVARWYLSKGCTCEGVIAETQYRARFLRAKGDAKPMPR